MSRSTSASANRICGCSGFLRRKRNSRATHGQIRLRYTERNRSSKKSSKQESTRLKRQKNNKNMVTRIIAINTSIFSHAEMRMDDCDSIQLVGPNNVGKSTLIYALNFLFIIDGHKMTFQRPAKR
jgi:ATPase subunit of ABC transporter with duplicated ATPase domains